MGMLEDDLTQFPPQYERKVHLYYDQEGATYRSMGAERRYADTLCKMNSTSPDMRVTTDPREVTCRICMKDARFKARLAALGLPKEPELVRVVRILEYVGERSAVERVLQQNAVKGFADFGPVTIREAMLPWPEVL